MAIKAKAYIIRAHVSVIAIACCTAVNGCTRAHGRYIVDMYIARSICRGSKQDQLGPNDLPGPSPKQHLCSDPSIGATALLPNQFSLDTDF